MKKAIFLFFITSAAFSEPSCPNLAQIGSKWDLWRAGTCLRGANIWQKVIEPNWDGDSLGNAPVGPPYLQADFDKLAALGANYVNLSVPGTFTERAPFVPDSRVIANLDQLISRAAKANLFVVISFRTGPGRNEAGFDSSERVRSLHSVWKDKLAQDAWVDMWRFTANRYRNQPVVVGYDLMVEPNANDVLLKIWEPENFFPRFRNSTYDWNPLAARISSAIRMVDRDTPILIGGMNYSDVYWLNSARITGDPKTVYAVHHYAPYEYTHQEGRLTRTYPGRFDADGDGRRDTVNASFLLSMLTPVAEFKAAFRAPVAVNEYGVMRWEKGAERYITDQIANFERDGANHAIWLWETSLNIGYDQFNFRFGPDPRVHRDQNSSALIEAIRSAWKRNSVRPSQIWGRW